MKKRILALILLAAMAITTAGCSQQSKAKNFGGTYELNLDKGKKLVQITWKDDELWYLTRDMKEGKEAETYEFKEDSNFGIMEGRVIIKESK